MEEEWKDHMTWCIEEEEFLGHEVMDPFENDEDAFWDEEDRACVDGPASLRSHSEQYYDCQRTLDSIGESDHGDARGS